MRLCLINNIPTPYIVPLFNSVNKLPGVSLHGIFLAGGDSNRRWVGDLKNAEFSYSVLRGFNSFYRRYELPVYCTFGLWRELKRHQTEVACICGYHYLASIELLIYARAKNVKTVLWSGSHLESGNFKNMFTDLYKRLVIGRFDSFVTYGSLAKDMLIHYGAPASRIVVGCNAVDTSLYAPGDSGIENRFMDCYRHKMRILYVGDLIPRKGVDVLIRAAALLRQQVKHEVTLVIVGDGPERERMKELARECGLPDVQFAGHQPAKEIIRYYRSADVFVLPSRKEVWGLVINEAMASGLPVIASRKVGAARDLISDGVNGFVYEVEDWRGLADKLRLLAENRELRRKMGNESLQIISARGCDEYADVIIRGCQI